MPDSLTPTWLDQPTQRPAYCGIPPDAPGMQHPDAPPLLAFYANPVGLLAINLARCAAYAASCERGTYAEMRCAARVAFRERLGHRLPVEIEDYLVADLW